MERVCILGCSQAAGGEGFRTGKGAAIPKNRRVVLINKIRVQRRPPPPLKEEKRRRKAATGKELKRQGILYFIYFFRKSWMGKANRVMRQKAAVCSAAGGFARVGRASVRGFGIIRKRRRWGRGEGAGICVSRCWFLRRGKQRFTSAVFPLCGLATLQEPKQMGSIPAGVE